MRHSVKRYNNNNAYARKWWKIEHNLLKSFNLPLRRISQIMAKDFRDEEFYIAFKTYFSYLWKDLCSYVEQRIENNKRRASKHLSRITIESADEILRRISAKHIRQARHYIRQGVALSELERTALIQKLQNKCATKERNRQAKEIELQNKTQEVCPLYVKNLIQIYFRERKRDSYNINTLYLILLEVSQFRCKKTISFLHKINSCDKNFSLRHMAFHILQDFGENPHLTRNRKGKRKGYFSATENLLKNPTEMLDFILRYQGTLHQKYDVFLSHSYCDKGVLLNLKRTLNQSGKTVYIDWVNNAVMLDRKNQNDDTINVLKCQMDASASMVLVLTDNSLRSDWVRMELDYFKQTGKPIYVFQPCADLTEKVPEDIASYPLL